MLTEKSSKSMQKSRQPACEIQSEKYHTPQAQAQAFIDWFCNEGLRKNGIYPYQCNTLHIDELYEYRDDIAGLVMKVTNCDRDLAQWLLDLFYNSLEHRDYVGRRGPIMHNGSPYNLQIMLWFLYALIPASLYQLLTFVPFKTTICRPKMINLCEYQNVEGVVNQHFCPSCDKMLKMFEVEFANGNIPAECRPALDNLYCREKKLSRTDLGKIVNVPGGIEIISTVAFTEECGNGLLIAKEVPMSFYIPRDCISGAGCFNVNCSFIHPPDCDLEQNLMKEKETECPYGLACYKKTSGCIYKHSIQLTECKNGYGCYSNPCPFKHSFGRSMDNQTQKSIIECKPQKKTINECKYKLKCNRPDCYFDHPNGRYIDNQPQNIINDGTYFNPQQMLDSNQRPDPELTYRQKVIGNVPNIPIIQRGSRNTQPIENVVRPQPTVPPKSGNNNKNKTNKSGQQTYTEKQQKK